MVSYQGRISDFAFLPEKPIAGPAPKVRQRGCPAGATDGVLIHHSHAQPSNLAWAQKCSTQSCGNRLPQPFLCWQQDCSSARTSRAPRTATGSGRPRVAAARTCTMVPLNRGAARGRVDCNQPLIREGSNDYILLRNGRRSLCAPCTAKSTGQAGQELLPRQALRVPGPRR